MPYDAGTQTHAERIAAAFAPKITDVYAVHGLAGRGMAEPATFLFEDAALKHRLGWVNGHLEDGLVRATEFYGKAQRINLRPGMALYGRVS